jgi:pimeloyl-ACP methyl ester carboxylesterase
MEGLEGVTLVGWSYGGMVITGVLSRIPHKDKGDDLLRRIRSRKRQGVD